MGQFEKAIFGDELTKILPELEHRSADIANLYSDEKVFVSDNELVHLIESMEVAERSLLKKISVDELGFLNDLQKRADVEHPTPYLHDQTIENILNEHPPVRLNEKIRPQESHFSPRERLAMTRFTEDKNWQNQYHKMLSSLKWQDFTNKDIQITRIDEHAISKFEIPVKPWGVSHSKECGVILVFDSSTNTRTPTLLRTSVFMHYVYEVHHFAKFLFQHKELRPGELAVNIIRSKKAMLPFLTDGNTHDETYYWEKALEGLGKEGIMNIKFAQAHLMRMTDSAASMNFIDVLWNINNVQGKTDHKYHLQQQAWVNLMQILSGLDSDAYSRFVQNQLMLDNLSFLEKVLK